jgi:hypothetical protein
MNAFARRPVRPVFIGEARGKACEESDIRYCDRFHEGGIRVLREC